MELHPICGILYCVCRQIGLPFNLMVLPGLFTDLANQIMSEARELKGSTDAVDLVTLKVSYLMCYFLLVLKIEFSVKVMVDLHVPPAIICLCKWQ